MQTPEFWHIDCPAARCFTPLSWLYAGLGKMRRDFAKTYKASVPVICVGNVVAGGAGKTPICLSLGEFFKKQNKTPVFLSYGYGGIYGGPLVVDPHAHQAIHVGDEALLLTRTGITVIGEDRVAASKLAVSEGADVIVMDDGFQNPYLHKDLSLLVVDGEYGVGNGRIIPAGPLREKFDHAVDRADTIVLYGQDKHHLFARIPSSKPILQARMVPDARQIEKLKGRKIMAFAGIGRPQKFYHMLRDYGLNVIETHDFPDHHYFNSSEIVLLIKEAERQGAHLVTTAKDLVRIEQNLQENIEPIHVRVEWSDPGQLEKLLSRFM